MWKCKKCGEKNEDSFDSCWSCGFGQDGTNPANAKEYQTIKEEVAKKEDANSNVAGIVILFISGAWALILLTRVQSIFGQKFLLISGDNLFNANGIALSNGAHLFLWLIAIGGFCFGLWAIISNSQKENTPIKGNNKRLSYELDDDERKCPSCAEKIKLEALKCKHCGEIFDPEDVRKQREMRAEERNEKMLHNDNEFIDGQNKKEYVCSECGSDVSCEDKKCLKCGADISASGGYICGECGADVSSEDKFCPKCGINLGELR